jgi:hypothetical protein
MKNTEAGAESGSVILWCGSACNIPYSRYLYIVVKDNKLRYCTVDIKFLFYILACLNEDFVLSLESEPK